MGEGGGPAYERTEVLKSAARAQLELQLGLSGAQLLGLEPGQLLEAGPPLSALHHPPRLVKANLTWE